MWRAIANLCFSREYGPEVIEHFETPQTRHTRIDTAHETRSPRPRVAMAQLDCFPVQICAKNFVFYRTEAVQICGRGKKILVLFKCTLYKMRQERKEQKNIKDEFCFLPYWSICVIQRETRKCFFFKKKKKPGALLFNWGRSRETQSPVITTTQKMQHLCASYVISVLFCSLLFYGILQDSWIVFFPYIWHSLGHRSIEGEA